MMQLVTLIAIAAMMLVITLIVGGGVRNLVTHIQARVWSSAVGDAVFLALCALVFAIDLTYHPPFDVNHSAVRLLAVMVGIVLGVGAVVWRTRRGVSDGR